MEGRGRRGKAAEAVAAAQAVEAEAHSSVTLEMPPLRERALRRKMPTLFARARLSTRSDGAAPRAVVPPKPARPPPAAVDQILVVRWCE